MTHRERRLVVTTFGGVSLIIAVVGISEWLIVGHISSSVIILTYLVAFASAPFLIPYAWEEWKSIKLPPDKADDPDKAGGST